MILVNCCSGVSICVLAERCELFVLMHENTKRINVFPLSADDKVFLPKTLKRIQFYRCHCYLCGGGVVVVVKAKSER